MNSIFKKHLEDKLKSIKKNPHLHTQNHLLADELAKKLNDRKHFGYYLKMTYLHDHNLLRNIMGQVLESKNASTPGRLFTYLLKKQLDNLKNHESTDTEITQ